MRLVWVVRSNELTHWATRALQLPNLLSHQGPLDYWATQALIQDEDKQKDNKICVGHHYKNNIDNMQQTHLFCNYHMEAI
jgi:hypothetical protein